MQKQPPQPIQFQMLGCAAVSAIIAFAARLLMPSEQVHWTSLPLWQLPMKWLSFAALALAMILGMTAISPKRPTAKLRLRFGLRMVFVIITALSCWLAYQANQVHRRRATLNEIKAVGGSCRGSRELSLVRHMLGDSVPIAVSIPVSTRTEALNWEWRLDNEFPELIDRMFLFDAVIEPNRKR